MIIEDQMASATLMRSIVHRAVKMTTEKFCVCLCSVADALHTDAEGEKATRSAI